MNETFRAIYDAFYEIPLWLLAFSVPFIAFQLAVSMFKVFVQSPRRSVATENEVKKSNSKPIPCDIHNDCSDCALYGTSYCWRVMKHE